MPSMISPTDFAEFEWGMGRTTEWDPATLQRLVPFLAGEQAVVVTDSRTGHAVTGEVVSLHDSTANSNYPHLGIRDERGDVTRYRVSDLGPIMLLGDSNVRWDAGKAMRDELQAALAAVRAHLGGIDFLPEHPHKGPRRWTTHLSGFGVTVAWGESFRDRRWYVDHDLNVIERG